MELLSYCKNLPKVELHAHLNGSLSDATVLNLLNNRVQKDADFSSVSAEVTIRKGEQRTLEDEAMKRSNIKVNLLLSIDRARGVEDAWSTFQLAKEYLTHDVFGPLVCGLDVSGNPHSGDLKDYLHILLEAKRCGLKLSVHLAEVPSNTEALTVLNSGLVDRIGHGTFLHPASGGTKALQNIVREQSLPLELCISSNIKGGTVKNARDHHFGPWKKENHPLVICTDDKGVFSTSLSEEFFLCAQTFSLSEDDLHNLCLSGVDAAFLSQVEKHKLRQEVQEELNFLKGKLAHS